MNEQTTVTASGQSIDRSVCDRVLLVEGGRREASSQLIAVAAFALLLAGQGLASLAIRPEPYPTIRMPGFASAGTPARTRHVGIPRIEAVGADGSVRSIDPSDVMEEFRYSAARASYDHVFRGRDPSAVSGPVREWMRNRIETLNEGFRPVAARLCWQQTEMSVVDASIVRQHPCVWETVPL